MVTIDTATEISVELENSPGTLGETARALGDAGVNILGFSLEAEGATGTARFVTDDPTQASDELETLGLSPATRDVLVTAVPHEPGQLGRIGAQLGNSGVNVEAGFPILERTGGQPQLAIAVDDIDSARKVLQE